MFAPKLYTVRKFPFTFIIENDFDIKLTWEEERYYHINQQDNMLFRQIRLITGKTNKFNPYLIFVDCAGAKNKKDELRRAVLEGFKLNGRRYVASERSASMVRTSILSFIDITLVDEIELRVKMDVDIGKTVLSKWYAYRGLMLSSCHNLEDWYPKMIVIPDYKRVIPEQHIKYVYDKTTTFIDKHGKEREWTQKEIGETVRDIEINAFDGCGVHHPAITDYVMEKLGSNTRPTSMILRAPFIKGVSNEFDYQRFFAERGVEKIKDVWGVWHDVTPGSEPMFILTESMYKGLKYFKQYGDIRDWEEYWRRFKRYQHCIGVAKWNFSVKEEPVYTRGNYQILQDLNLPYEEFGQLAGYSIEWVEKIISGDPVYTMCFLGFFADKHKALNDYMEAALKNPEMLKEPTVRSYLITLVQKYIDEMKCGKLYLKSCFKFLVPDLIMLMEHAGGLEPKGCLKEDEFFSFNRFGTLNGEYLIERNPHICKSEHVILKATTNELIEKYCNHLSNVCMVNCLSITPQRLNGADFDGDLVLVVDNELMMRGVDRNASIVIDIEDKVTALDEDDTPENRVGVVLRGMTSLIGETSNCATTYHNKRPRSEDQRKVYEGYVDLLSVINGKAIDAAKTGVIFNIPRHIAKYGKPLPYFMRYASDYYKKLKNFSRSPSNMNRLCREIEKWEKSFRWKRTFKEFDYHIMIDESIPFNQERFDAIEEIFLEFCKEMKQLKSDEREIQNENIEFTVNWNYYYDYYRNKCEEVCSYQKELANIAVLLCYENHPTKNKKFLWRIAGSGVVQNIKQVDYFLPIEASNGEYEYLGKRYNLMKREDDADD